MGTHISDEALLLEMKRREADLQTALASVRGVIAYLAQSGVTPSSTSGDSSGGRPEVRAQDATMQQDAPPERERQPEAPKPEPPQRPVKSRFNKKERVFIHLLEIGEPVQYLQVADALGLDRESVAGALSRGSKADPPLCEKVPEKGRGYWKITPAGAAYAAELTGDNI